GSADLDDRSNHPVDRGRAGLDLVAVFAGAEAADAEIVPVSFDENFRPRFEPLALAGWTQALLVAEQDDFRTFGAGQMNEGLAVAGDEMIAEPTSRRLLGRRCRGGKDFSLGRRVVGSPRAKGAECTVASLSTADMQ